MVALRRIAVPLVVAGALLGTVGCGSGRSTAEADVGSVWVANEGSNTVSVLDAASGDVRATLAGIGAPHNVQADVAGETVWAVSGNGLLVGLDVAEAAVDRTAPTGAHPAHVVQSGDGTVYVTSSEEGSLTAYRGGLAHRVATDLGGAPHGVRLGRDGAIAVVANSGSGTVDVVDTEEGTVSARVPVGESPVQVAVAAEGDEAFVTVGGSSELVRVDLSAGKVTGRVPMPASPAQVLLTAADELLVANQGTPEHPGDTVSVVDPDSLRVLASVRTGSGPHGLTADAAGERAWVTNAFEGTVTMIDVVERRAVRTVDVGDSPNGISFSPAAPPADLGMVALDLPHSQLHRGHDHGIAEHGGHGPSGHASGAHH